MENDEKPNPKKRANLFSSIFFLYSWESFRNGKEHFWNETNLYQILDDQRSEVLGEKIEKLWLQHVLDCKSHKRNPNLVRVIFKIFWINMIRDGFYLIFSNIPRLVQPILIGKLLSYFSIHQGSTRNEASICLVSLIFINFMGVLSTGQFKLSAHTTMMKIKFSCMALIHKKVLKMKVSTLHERKCGNALTLISNDLSQFDQSPYHIHFIWASPLFLLSTFFILIFDAGIPGFVGVVWFVLYMFFQIYLARLTGSFRNRIAINTENRVRLMNEILNGMKIIKMFVWENVFIRLVTTSRKNELKEINKVNYLKSFYYTISQFVNIMAVFLGLLTMVLLNEEITVPKIFNLVAYYNSFNFLIAVMFPLSITKVTEILQVFERVNNFIMSDEIDDEKIIKDSKSERIILQNVNAKWNSSPIEHDKFMKPNPSEMPLLQGEENQLVLRNISMNVYPNEFLGIIGPVGSGKSSLIQSILGETLISGDVSINGNKSYASQDPWIFRGTIRDNIIFGETFDEKRYQEVLRVCCLNQDLEQFPEGDLVVVDEHGTSLSGGQKSRINLARAVYKKSDLYLLDNPLSSLDVKVADRILKDCINGFLSNECRIFVTNCIQHLEKCDRLIVLNSGRIEDEGSYEKISKNTEKSDNLDHVDKNGNMETFGTFEVSSKFLDSKKKIEENSHRSEKLIFLSYLKSGNSFCFISIVLCAFIINQFLNISIFYYVSYWGNIEEQRNFSRSNIRTLKNNFTFNPETLIFVYIFVFLLGIYLASSILQAILYSNMVIKNSKKIHENLLKNLMKCKMKFFDQTESGKILSRFAKDLGFVDDHLVRNLIQSFVVIFALGVRLCIITYLNPYMIIVVTFTILFLCYSTKLFVNTTQNLKRLESSLIEPVLTHLNATIQGLTTIRAAEAQNMMKKQYDTYQDHYASSYYMYITVSYAFSFAIEFMSFIFITIVTTSCFFMEDIIRLNGGEIGLMISQTVLLTTSLQFGIIQLVLVKNNLISVERILSYNKLPQEIQIEKTMVAEEWPQKGIIKFKNVKVFYREDIPTPVLDLSFSISDEEKIGIIGRTGAGKSTIFSAILQLISFQGSIEISSDNIEEIPLDILRSRIGVIPQDPTLFSGTLRFNLDPLGEFNDNILYETLNQIGFSKVAADFKNLDDAIKENGINLSVGQRQVICLARIILKKNKIVMMDEATSNMDKETDELIRKVMRKEFSKCTVLTITHKLSTAMDFDRIMVIDEGRIIQFDCPQKLMLDHRGEFYKMMNKSIGKVE